MKFAFPALMFALVALALPAQAAPDFAGDSNCQVANDTGERSIAVKWSGPCVDGFAEGTGVLDITAGGTELLHYEGMLNKGLMQGTGYLRRAGNMQYEGGFDSGKYNGTGTELNFIGRYDGEWKRGYRHGKGKQVYTVGGVYDGEWKGNRFHGLGTATYMGGRNITTQFIKGVRHDQQPLKKPEAKYSVTSDRAAFTGSMIRAKAVSKGVVPFSESYEEMSEDDKATVRSWYPLMDDGDEPPYPLKGTASMYQAISTAVGKMRVSGILLMYVDVDANGVPSQASTYSSPSPEFAKVAMSIAMLQKFKPAQCTGKPCAGKFPVSVKFGMN